MKDDASPTRFNISAAVVFRLGEELISDVFQAIVELVKNSYDADATWAKVTIITPQSDAPKGSSEALGEIIVEDDGYGMTKTAFERGWLTIADSEKKSMKDLGETTTKGRTPVGDKGLGRLGVQRLGHDVEITTRVSDPNSPELKLAFSWRSFSQVKYLTDVPFDLIEQPRSKRRKGTKVVVRDLKDVDQWKGDDAKSRLQKGLSELISPFKEVRDFSASVSLDGEDISIVEITEQVRNAAMIRYVLGFDQKTFRVDGKIKLSYVERAQSKEDRLLLKKLIRQDDGKSYYQSLLSSNIKGKPANLEYHENSKWFLSYSFELSLADLGGCHKSDDKIANPGPFSGEIDYIMLDSEDFNDQILDSKSDFKTFTKQLAGVRVYRNGFGIRVSKDFLGLGKQATSGGSLYALRPDNTIGFVAITAENNNVLLETTSREGFQKTPHYLNFYALLQKFVSFSGNAQEFLRRGSIRFLQEMKEQDAGLELKHNIFSATEKIREHAIDIDKRGQQLSSVQKNISEITKKARTQVKNLTSNDKQFSLFYKEKLDKFNVLLQELEDAFNMVDNAVTQNENNSSTLARAQQILDVILERDKRLRSEIEMFYEGAALGLTAEVLSHEISSIADSLAKRSSVLIQYLANNSNKDLKVLQYVEQVKSSVAALRKQLSHLDPSLRYVREQREKITMSEELNQMSSFYRDRFLNFNIEMSIDPKNDFIVSINRGKLNQIFDNLFLNSEFWLREYQRTNSVNKGQIYVEIEKPFIRVWDNGNGIAFSVESNLFEPFVTTKQAGKGRGLGLFIIRQLLDTEGCAISLLREKNASGRRYKFEIDFTGVLDDRDRH